MHVCTVVSYTHDNVGTVRTSINTRYIVVSST